MGVKVHGGSPRVKSHATANKGMGSELMKPAPKRLPKPAGTGTTGGEGFLHKGTGKT